VIPLVPLVLRSLPQRLYLLLRIRLLPLMTSLLSIWLGSLSFSLLAWLSRSVSLFPLKYYIFFIKFTIVIRRRVHAIDVIRSLVKIDAAPVDPINALYATLVGDLARDLMNLREGPQVGSPFWVSHGFFSTQAQSDATWFLLEDLVFLNRPGNISILHHIYGFLKQILRFYLTRETSAREILRASCFQSW
jgi:hypothetical protein